MGLVAEHVKQQIGCLESGNKTVVNLSKANWAGEEIIMVIRMRKKVKKRNGHQRLDADVIVKAYHCVD